MAVPFIGGNQRKTNNFIVVVFGVFAAFLVHGVSEDDATGISLAEGDSVTLHTGVETSQQNKIKWYFQNILIAQIIVNPSQICTDVQCSNGTESFRNRLKLDNQTGSLTIMNIRKTDAEDYKLNIFSSSSRPRQNVFKVSVNDGSAAKVKVKRGESVTLDTRIQIKTTDVIKWHFNDHLIATISGNVTASFREGLMLDNQTGSLTIMNTTDSGDYYVEIMISRSNNFNVTILKNFSVNVTGLSSVFKAILWSFILTPAAGIAASMLWVIYRRRMLSRNDEKKYMKMTQGVATEKVVLQMEKGPNPADQRGSGFNAPISQNKQQ